MDNAIGHGARGRKLGCLGLLAWIAVTSSAAAAQSDWQMAPPLPQALGEIVGAVVGTDWYVMSGLDVTKHEPAGVVYVFDAAHQSWLEKKRMPEPAHHVMAAVAAGKIYVFGGFVSGGTSGETTPEAGWRPIDSAWVYDPALDQWSPLARMPTPRGAGWAVELGGKIYVIGGAQVNIRGEPADPISPETPQRVLGTVEEYDPASNHWVTRAPMPTPRNHFVAEAVDGKIYAIGGRLGAAQITVADDTDVVEEYDPARDQWRGRGRAPIRSSGMAAAVQDGKIYVAGGEYQDWEGAKALWAAEAYDPRTGRWEMLPRMHLAHHGFAAGVIGNSLHVVGGGFQSDGMPGVNTKTPVHEVLQIGP